MNFILPKEWIDLKADQLLFVSKLFVSEFAKQQYEFLVHAFVRFTGLRIMNVSNDGYLVKKKGEKSFYLRQTQIHSVASTLNFLLDKVTETKPLPRIRSAKPLHHRLYDTPLIVFLMAENYYMAYKTTNETAYLDCLMETLYRRANKEFDDKKIKDRSRYYRFVSIEKKYTVFLWYAGFRWFVSQECPHLFSQTDVGKEPKIKDHVRSMIRGLTEGDVTKNDKVIMTDTWQALYELDAKAKDAKTLKEQIDKMKTHV